MNFNTTNSTFRQLFGNGLNYKVPAFQRDYSWTDDEWDDLWQDIEGLYEEDGEPAHYMGYLVLQSSDNKAFDIIDGQQRITTISVLILAALSFLDDLVQNNFDAEKNAQRKEQLRNSYIGYIDPVSLVARSKLTLNRHNNKFYQNFLVPLEPLPQRGLNHSEHQLRKAFLWFKDRIKSRFGLNEESGAGLTQFIDQLVDKLFFTVINVTDELNAFKVFETLNARGVRLSATDLLKNYLFSLISNADIHEVELKSLEDHWERIVGLLGNESFPEFLRIFWNSRNRLVRKSDLFKTIRRNVKNREEAFQLIRDLGLCASIYAALRDPHDSLWNEIESKALSNIQMFNVRQPLAMLLTCHQAFFQESREVFTDILRSIAVVSFRYNVICSMQAHDQERVYNEIAWKLSDGTYSSKKDVIDNLRSVYPDDNQFKAAFSDKELRTTNSRNKKVVRYILFEIEKQKSNTDFNFESAKYNIEHILPEKPDLDDWAHIDESHMESMTYRLGNMTLLDAVTNRKIGNQGYEVKRNAYQESVFEITKSIAEHHDGWSVDAISLRQKQMAKIAASVWKIQF